MLEATIMNDLKNQNIMPKARTREFSNTLKAVAMRHNAEFTKDTLDKFRTGSRRYTLSWTALVWDEQAKGTDKTRQDRRSDVVFKTDLVLNQITDAMILEIIIGYYSIRDYPDFIELITHKVLEIDRNKDINERSHQDKLQIHQTNREDHRGIQS
jgi:hypothetical protein